MPGRGRGKRSERERWWWPGMAGLWLVTAAACQEPNPDFDGPAESGNDTQAASTSTGTEPVSTTSGPVVTSDGTSSGEPPGTSSGEPPGTSSGEPGGSTTEGCMGMVCDGVCVDTMTSNDHCGMCNNDCVGQQMCVDGECIVP